MSDSDSNSENSQGLAALLSAIGIFFPILSGAGQIYNGEVGKGVAFSVVQCIHIAIVVFFFWTLVPLITYPAVGIFAAYDAYKNA